MLNSSLLFVSSLSNQLLPNSKTRESNNSEPYSSDTTAKELFQCSYYFSLPSEVKLASELSLQHFFLARGRGRQKQQRSRASAAYQGLSTHLCFNFNFWLLFKTSTCILSLQIKKLITMLLVSLFPIEGSLTQLPSVLMNARTIAITTVVSLQWLVLGPFLRRNQWRKLGSFCSNLQL